jgi:transcription antitermination factor NusG
VTNWYAVQTQPHKEFLVHRTLGAAVGIETYLPTLHVKPANPRARKRRPFFPGYLFVQADLEEVGLSPIQWAPGVVRVLGCDDVPIPIPEHLIAEIQRRLGRVQKEDPLGLGRLKKDDRVRITTGPFAGYEGMFDLHLDGRTRVRILVEFLGRITPAEVDIRALEKVRSDPGRSP